jgi:GNAT superfamily N-acetyltransferase
MSCRKLEVAQATPDRIGALAPLFGRAFADEPMTHWSLGDRREAYALTRCFAYFLEQVLGLGLVWEVGAGNGAAVWVPSDYFEEWDVHPWNQPRITALTDDDGRRYVEFWDWVDSHHPTEPLWQLDSIAVEASAQGQGLGRNSLRPVWLLLGPMGSARFSRPAPPGTSRSTDGLAFVSSTRLTRRTAARGSTSCAGIRKARREHWSAFGPHPRRRVRPAEAAGRTEIAGNPH